MSSDVLAPASAAPPLVEVLAGAHGLGPVRRLVSVPPGAGGDSWPTVPGLRGERCVLLRTKFKPGRSLTAWYAEAGNGTRDRAGGHLCVTWVADGAEVLRAPQDPVMPQLRELHDPSRRHDLIASVCGQPLSRSSAGDLHTVRYRPRQRHVLMLRAGAGRPGLVVKLDRDDSGQASVPLARVLGPLLAARCPSVRLVEPFGYAAAARTAVWVQAPGVPLSTSIRTNGVAAIRLLRVLGRATRCLHDTGSAMRPGLAGSLTLRESRDVADELATTRRAGDLLRLLLPGTWSTYNDVLATVGRGLSSLPPGERTVVHGDLKADNVLVDWGSLRLLDLDRMSWADPALDLGRLLADLGWWCRDRAVRDILAAAFRAGYRNDDVELWQRAALWAASFELRQAARRCAVHDPHWDRDITRRVREAADELRRAELGSRE